MFFMGELMGRPLVVIEKNCTEYAGDQSKNIYITISSTV